MATQSVAPKPNRTPWIIVGVLGCLVLCLLVAVVGGGAFFVLSPSSPKPAAVTIVVATTAPVVTAPTVVAPTVVVPTIPPVVVPTIPPVTAPTVSTLPTLALATAVPVPTLAPAPTAVPPTARPAAPAGHLAFTVRKGDRPEDNYIWTMNADGTGAKQILTTASEPSFSPDGTKIAYYHWTDGLFVANSDGSDPKKILGDGATGYIAWSHDGHWIAFSARPGYSGNIFLDAVLPDGTALKDKTARRNITIGWSPTWSPDDTQVAFQTCRGSSCGIYKASSGGGDAIPIVTDDGGLAAWSPDGKRIVYQKDEGGQKQLFMINADGTGKKQLTSGVALHVDANWSPDGNFIFYRSPEGGTWAIWRMNADGTNPVKLADNLPPGDWPYDRIAVTK